MYQIFTDMKLKYLSCLGLILFCSSIFAQEAPLWMRYPSLSPDGKTIVFSYQGDLYKIPSSGGTATPLTLHQAHDKNPVWSHDGKHIAFASDRYGNFDVYLIPIQGGKAQRLTYHSSNDFPSDFTEGDENVLFSSSRLDAAKNQQFPSGVLSELYQVPIAGGRIKQVLTTPAEEAKINKDGSVLLFQDRKGYENTFRKHHTSSVTRDIWSYHLENKKYTKLTAFKGEDRSPVFNTNLDGMYYLSEQSGTFNVFSMLFSNSTPIQLTTFNKHPVRYLSSSDAGLLCFSYNSEIYTMQNGSEPQKVKVTIYADERFNTEKVVSVRGNVNHLALSPNGMEVAYIVRGEVFVSSVKKGTTKRITNTPEQERTVDFSADGRSLVYAGERNGSWNLYQTSIDRKEEKYFFNSTLLKEEVILSSDKETFQPSYSPDGKEVAFLEERTALKVINLKTKVVREIVAGDKNYSYSDGDQYYSWSPDGKWFLVNFLQEKQWIDQAGLVSSKGGEEIVNLTKSGYGHYGPQWAMDGKMMLSFSSRDGMKNHASWGGQLDIYGLFFTQEAYDTYTLNEEEYELANEDEDKDKKEDKEDDKKKKDKKNKDKEKIKPLKFDLENIEDRKVRLSIHSANLSDAYVDKKGENLYYLARFEKGYNLWKTNLRTKETKILSKLGSNSGGEIIADKDDENLFILASGSIYKIDLSNGEKKNISIKGEMLLNEMAEREYLFDHAWRQVVKKFYRKDLHGVEWDFYKKEYARFLPYINNNHDFAEMLSELLGELNASHTGARYRSSQSNGASTACLGLYYDESYLGDGLRILEVMDKSPVVKNSSKIKAGVIIEKIDGKTITTNTNYYAFLDRKSGKYTLLSLYNPENKKRWEERVKPISLGRQYQLTYERWVKNCEKIVDELSGGKIGYVHVRGMDDRSYRTVYETVLGKHANKEALIVDTRFNGGGWLHDDLATFLNGKTYLTFMPRGQNLGNEPQFKWRKPSAVVMSEGNYSDAHMFPYTYNALGIGKLIGMPVPGTGTAVWWERLQNGVVFGIPQVGMQAPDNTLLENTQLEPDIKVNNEPMEVSSGTDAQLAAAVKELQSN